ncbi:MULTISPECIES: 2,3-bisphosphoglycerate-dependent phosphoglycerate mutase [unclassified Novosphingobium]|uniref:2,3-bisphosphoglycerate-dependent phosphoglycerate mutase n=1 Tax=unclassified Novosphingobium TaxID=2644732 RepID=UPI000D30C648|nr:MULTISPECIES: 2,3-bisphosphoglycerate-dependent phosphoglycerate mutase [unclassified Novosphingobium]PTR12592.1 phosphoglycerate mutase [Novosphingobium sp. GV055]PUB06376.1 phosphoglycerate mutase [Novosphingobium sp. GV061]PUB22427.1 phosphoglycerate mutase [Novosphingobium sp. GV079]PUB44452.1 phosphoglycerate mutase [Novosphingobium sp. GV027]
MSDISGKLVLIRHGESVANAKNIFTGRSASPLTRRGEQQMRDLAHHLTLKGLKPDRCFTSTQERARKSAAILLKAMSAENVPTVSSAALDERDYGALTGLTKTAAVSKWGEEQVRIWRRSYAIAPPGGESLQETAARVLAFYKQAILPSAQAGGITLVIAHGNSLRALISIIEGEKNIDINNIEIAPGEAIAFLMDGGNAGRKLLNILPINPTW